jgi:hypothetical protein
VIDLGEEQEGKAFDPMRVNSDSVSTKIDERELQDEKHDE